MACKIDICSTRTHIIHTNSSHCKIICDQAHCGISWRQLTW